MSDMLLPDKIRLSALALGLSLAAFACAAPTIPDETQEPEDTESGATEKKKPTTKKDDKTSSSSSSGGTTMPPKGDEEGEEPPPGEGDPTTPAPTSCSTSTSYDACYQCCDPTDSVAPAIDAFGSCVCQSPGTCAAQCGSSYCSGNAPTAACEACLNSATACEAKADAACGTACKAAMACVTSSKCDDKP